MKALVLLLFTSVILTTGCITGEQVRNVDPGMTKKEVIDQVGKPDGYQKEGEYEVLQYTNRLISGWSWDKADYYFVFKNDRLEKWGTGTVRPQQTNTGTIIFIPLK